MRFGFVTTRNSQRVINWLFTLIVGFASSVVCVGLALLIGAIAGDSPTVRIVGFFVSALPPLLIVVGGLTHGMRRPPDQSGKID